MKYGYARVSTTDQDLTIQIDALKNAGCETIRQEKVSGTSIKGRDELNTLLEFLRKGDELVVTRIDRLARSIRDLQNIVYDLDKLAITPKDHGEVVHDLPGGEWRRVRTAHGYRAIMVNGEITFEEGVCTGATPGKLLRHGRG